MIVLALDGATARFSAALVRDGEAIGAVELPANVALESGLAAAAQLLSESSLPSGGVDRLAVGIGPGSFTGVRIAISYAKALAQGWERPLTGVSTFDAIEAGMPVCEPLLTAVRGRRGVVSVRYRAGNEVQRWSGYVNDVLDRLGSGAGSLYVAGDTQDVIAGLAERGWSVEPLARAVTPAALAVAMIAGEREPARTYHEVRADYGELPAAKIPKFPGALGETTP